MVLSWILFSVGLQGKEIVLGNYGQTLESTPIFKAASTEAGKFYQAKQYQYLVVQKFTPEWTKVLMANNVWGYIDASKIAILPELYRVNATRVRRDVTKNLIDGQYTLEGISYGIEGMNAQEKAVFGATLKVRSSGSFEAKIQQDRFKGRWIYNEEYNRITFLYDKSNQNKIWIGFATQTNSGIHLTFNQLDGATWFRTVKKSKSK